MTTHPDFHTLINAIQNINTELTKQASHAVNLSLTLRNWCIGFCIAEYQLNGGDRATYGDKLLAELEKSLVGVSNCSRRLLYDYIKFFKTYPQIAAVVYQQLPAPLLMSNAKVRTVSAQSGIQANLLISKLSYSQFNLLVAIENDDKRAFYEQETMRGNWSVRELKRQINSLYYERSALSLNKDKLATLTQQAAEQQTAAMTVRDPYVFEFLGLKPKEVMSESHLEEQLLAKLEDFLLELGHGFCFESRQKRILIGNSHYFVDLVFYHRLLKCHVLIELKLAEFNHENIGQLNTYVSWYKKNMMAEGDNPPIGILLCTDKDHALVEYALAGMDSNLFVSKYQLELPNKEAMQRFIEEKLRESDA